MKKDRRAYYVVLALMITGIIVGRYVLQDVVKPRLDESAAIQKAEADPKAFFADARPADDMLLHDYAGVLSYQKEGVNTYLQRIKDNNGIEMMIVTLPTLKGTGLDEDPRAAAFRLFNNWNTGRDYNGNGVLLLVVLDTKQAKIEIAQNVEDVFTDLFSGYVTDNQLSYYIKEDMLGEGLIAIMEEFELRAQIKTQGGYSPASIAQMDRKYISMGAGVMRDLSKYKEQKKKDPVFGTYSKGAETPDEAWKIIVSKLNGERKYKDVDVFTDAGKLICGDQDKLNYNWAKMYKTMPYEIKQRGNYAIVSFGKKKGWDNSPMLLMKTSNPEGWKMDWTAQRKYVVMGSAPDWMIEITDNPYMLLSFYAWTSFGKDIPVGSAIYHAKTDAALAGRYVDLKKQYRSNPNDFDVALELGALGAIMALQPNDIYPYLEKAKKLNPGSPEPYRYMAIQTVESNFQYATALKNLQEFLKRGGDPVFGNNYLGFANMRLKNYRRAIQYFEESLKYSTAQKEPNYETHNQIMYSYEKLYICYDNIKENQKAKDMLNLMRETDPDHWRTQMYRSQL